mmetsp:Transcript_38914/g.44332  ORF Transcript_38914/g.44332 Transcript_38914/m.44332 type:complete len:545 (+) Transcript_38914:312-1946(+)|eukprot:CAMPEP_0114998084 /NCGR_PEP_ID=MMETSP0216-20121206/15286_1 /TAXON_ID=223996 /ORGANISM="Protocruzia adherens, Strain Boccale" /LENGTH=544 /DNA_ID=CAMNT_0002362593 /DNA_START=242 /DNA_END=1876 /DNA_ORIENTATION=+
MIKTSLRTKGFSPKVWRPVWRIIGNIYNCNSSSFITPKSGKSHIYSTLDTDLRVKDLRSKNSRNYKDDPTVALEEFLSDLDTPEFDMYYDKMKKAAKFFSASPQDIIPYEFILLKSLRQIRSQQTLVNFGFFLINISLTRNSRLVTEFTEKSKLIEIYNPRYLRKLIYIFSRLKPQDTSMLDVYEKQVLKMLRQFEFKDIALIMWSYCSLRKGSPVFFQTVERHIVANKDKLTNPQDIANILWAFTIDPRVFIKRNIFELVEGNVIAQASQFTAKSLANIIWAFAKARRGNQKLMTHLEPTVIDLLPKFNSQDLSNTIYAYAILNAGSDHLFDKFAEAIIKRFHVTFNVQERFNVSWSFCVRGRKLYPEVMEIMLKTILNSAQEKKMNHKQRTQLVQTLLELELNYPQLHKWIKDNYTKFLSQDVSLHRNRTVSTHQRTIGRALKALKYEFEHEKLLGFYAVDFFIEPNIVIELDGPHHFINGTTEPLGPTLMKKRHLEAHGYKVANFSHVVISNLGSSSNIQRFLDSNIQLLMKEVAVNEDVD